MIVRTNFTGRRFICLGLEENEDNVEHWSNGFTLGRTYNECQFDLEGRNRCDLLENVIILFNDDRNTCYVDINMFQETEPLAEIVLKTWICLN